MCLTDKSIIYKLMDEAAECRRVQRVERDDLPAQFVDVLEEMDLTEAERRSDMVSMVIGGFHSTGLGNCLGKPK